MSFTEQVQALRDEYSATRSRHNLFGPSGRGIEDVSTERSNGRETEIFWLSSGQYIRLVNTPGTLSGDILRLKRNLPDIDGSFEIDGDQVRKVETVPPLPVRENDYEDITEQLGALPTVTVDNDTCHLKQGKYASEIKNLLRCQGGGCPGQRMSPYIVALQGKSADGRLVFEKLLPRFLVFHRFCSVTVYKRWILHLVEALKTLHSLGMVHRDVHLENLLFTPDGSRLVLGDLECRWGQRAAPEIACDDGIDSGWTQKSDIYDVGTCIQAMIYANVPATVQVEWPVPPPFEHIVKACKRPMPEDRPTLEELSALLNAIDDD